MKLNTLLLIPFLSILISCAIADENKDHHEQLLYKYAYSNCLFWYFNHKGYDVEDIRSISGGIVETSDISIERFQEIALFIKNYKPQIETKAGIDINLNKCFHLEKSEGLARLVKEHK